MWSKEFGAGFIRFLDENFSNPGTKSFPYVVEVIRTSLGQSGVTSGFTEINPENSCPLLCRGQKIQSFAHNYQ